MSTNELPEQTAYVDEGCELAPRCLACPLPACRYDLPHKRAGTLTRQAQIAALLSEGIPLTRIHTQMGVSRRTVFRLHAQMRTTGGTNELRQPY